VVGAVDLTLEDDATGSDVVLAVIAKLDFARIFDSDHRFLRRLAFVENGDGVNSTSTDYGGIWALEESKFGVVLTAPELEEVYRSIRRSFAIEWSQVKKNDLRKPFYSGLAARLYLYYLEITATASIPLAGNIQEQAQFWITYYHSSIGRLPSDHFVEQVILLEQKEGCKVNTDIFFVLDGSGSIGTSNFDQVRKFEEDFVKKMVIGPRDNQVGTIVFSAVGSIIFYLNSYNSTNDVLNAIQAIPYPGDSTNTPDGLCKMVKYGFTEEHGARSTSAAVFRIAIVMTDGRSNEQSSECQWDTIQAAEAVHRLSPPVLVYVIGVTDDINEQELEAIATDSEDITYLASFDSHILQRAQEDHLDEVCEKASVPAGTDEEMNGTLDKDETVRYHFPIPVIGITVKVCISAGHILVYGSVLVPNPNSAFYDWVLELDYEHSDQEIECKNVFIDPSTIQHKHPAEDKVSSTITFPPSPTSSPQPSMPPGSGFSPGTVLSDEILYISVMGKQNENNFVLNGTVGDIYPESDSSPEPKPESETMFIIVAAGSSGTLLLVLSCIFTVCCVCGCVICRKKKPRRVNQYKLLAKDVDNIC
jgi:receptor-type tyrosine-protein phosphatase Q